MFFLNKEYFPMFYTTISLFTVILCTKVKIHEFFCNIFYFFLKKLYKYYKKKPYVVFIISKKSGLNEFISEEFISVIKEKSEYKINYFLKKIQIKIEIIEDCVSITKNDTIIRKIARDSNCLCIVGCVTSTLSKTVLSIILKEKDPPAYIMPIATNPEITSYSLEKNYHCLLRLPPTDVEQVKTIVKYIEKKYSKSSIILFGDCDNKDYSEYLLEELSKMLYDKNFNILYKSIQSDVNMQNFKDYKNNTDICIIYAGMGRNGFVLLSQLHLLEWTSPIIFTDGYSLELIIQQNEKYNFKKIISFQGKMEDPINEENIYKIYNCYAKDSLKLIEKILSESKTISRKYFKKTIIKEKNKLSFLGSAGRYKFEENGNNTGIQFSLYEVKKDNSCTKVII